MDPLPAGLLRFAAGFHPIFMAAVVIASHTTATLDGRRR
jgi:hypothetical protein